jgi:hypothetical protein
VSAIALAWLAGCAIGAAALGRLWWLYGDYRSVTK